MEETHEDSIWSSHIPVLLHWTGSVLDEGAPFGCRCEGTAQQYYALLPLLQPCALP
jgi:hypothetical protein